MGSSVKIVPSLYRIFGAPALLSSLDAAIRSLLCLRAHNRWGVFVKRHPSGEFEKKYVASLLFLNLASVICSICSKICHILWRVSSTSVKFRTNRDVSTTVPPISDWNGMTPPSPKSSSPTQPLRQEWTLSLHCARVKGCCWSARKTVWDGATILPPKGPGRTLVGRRS